MHSQQYGFFLRLIQKAEALPLQPRFRSCMAFGFQAFQRIIAFIELISSTSDAKSAFPESGCPNSFPRAKASFDWAITCVAGASFPTIIKTSGFPFERKKPG